MAKGTKRRFMFHHEADSVLEPHVWMGFARNMGFSKSILINKTRDNIPNNPEAYVQVKSIEQGLDLVRGSTLVWLKPPESLPGSPKYRGYSPVKYDFSWLKDFEHPEDTNVVYIIGPDQWDIPSDTYINPNDPKHKVVGIEIERNSLWGIVAGSIVARDVYTKEILSGKAKVVEDLMDVVVTDKEGKQVVDDENQVVTKKQYVGENLYVSV